MLGRAYLDEYIATNLERNVIPNMDKYAMERVLWHPQRDATNFSFNTIFGASFGWYIDDTDSQFIEYKVVSLPSLLLQSNILLHRIA